MELQDIYDQTVRHLARQGGPAKRRRTSDHGHTETICAYRGVGGSRCSVGYWIPDEEYLEEIEGLAFCSNSAENPLIVNEIQELLPPGLVDNPKKIKLLQRLQKIHDNSEVRPDASGREVWFAPWGGSVELDHGIAKKLEILASEFNLNNKILFEEFPR